jgi:hypothetical protein
MHPDSPVLDSLSPDAGPATGSASGVPVSPVVEWRYDPWTEARARAAIAVVAAVALPVAAAFAGLRGPALAIAALAVFASLAPGFVATTCRIDDAGVSWRLGALPRSFRPWARIDRGRVLRRAVRLDAAAASGWLARLRAIALPLPAASGALRDSIAATLARHAG